MLPPSVGSNMVSLAYKRRKFMTNITNYKHPSLLGMNVVDGLFDSFFVDFPRHLKQTTQGYPVADIYSDDDGNTVM